MFGFIRRQINHLSHSRKLARGWGAIPSGAICQRPAAGLRHGRAPPHVIATSNRVRTTPCCNHLFIFELFLRSGIYTGVKQLIAGFIAGWFCLTGLHVRAANTHPALLLDAATARPGDTVFAAVRLRMDPGWHTYWKNPGGPGIATKVDWTLPAGVIAGELQWPPPEKLVPEKTGADGKVIPGQLDYEWTTYVYHDEVILLAPLKFESGVKPGTLELKASVSWQECKGACLLGKQDVTATIQIGGESKPSPETELIAAAKKKLPNSAVGLNARAWWEKPASGDTRPILLEWSGPAQVDQVDFFPEASEQFEVQSQTETIPAAPGTIRLRKQIKKLEGDWPKTISGELILKAAGKLQSFAVKLPIPDLPGAKPSAPAAAAVQSLWRMLLYAFIGGLILNIMPCVLPVIALKILAFVSQSKEAPGRVRKLGLVYAAGVLVSFLALAALVLGVKAAGHQAGWGMQFSNPQFIVILTALVTLVALNLFGLFEVTLSGRVMGAAGDLASQHGASGAFFNGVLATILATPCTAPFLGAALGFAFAQSAAVIVLMFLTIGLGLAAPYVVLSWHPAWLKFLPQPGAWMEKFKIAMGFPMLATAVWLFSLAATFYGDRTWWLGVFLVFLGAAAWMFGEFFQRGRRRRGLALALTVVVLMIGYAWAVEANLRWRSPNVSSGAGESIPHAPEGYAWRRWSPEAVTQARAEGRPVIVDFTARWCQTCNISVKPALETKPVIAKLQQLKAVALLADYTRFPPAISEVLTNFNRNGVPLVLVYPADASKPPLVLPEPLPFPVPYTPVLLEALNQAGP